jgi:hypothetical protein
MLPAMFVVSEEAAAAIRTTYEQDGELSAAIEVRRLFPGITDNVRARECARSIAGWKPLPAAACQITPLRQRQCLTNTWAKRLPSSTLVGVTPDCPTDAYRMTKIGKSKLIL